MTRQWTEYARECSVCGSADVMVTTTYKHHWRVCRECGCAESRVRRHPPLAFLPVPHLRVNRSVLAAPEKVYDYASAPAEKLRADEEQARRLADEWINLFKIDLHGKKLIEIGGGTGQFVRTLEQFGAQVFHTEYDAAAVAHAKRTGLPSWRLDFGADRLQDLTGEVFDIVVLKGALEYCTDVRRLLSGMARNVRPGSRVIVIAAVPTLGNFLYTQFVDYNQAILYQPDVLVKIFGDEGYALRHRRDFGETRTRGPLTLYRAKRALPLMIWYMVPALFRLPPDPRFLFHALDVRGVQLVFEKQ